MKREVIMTADGSHTVAVAQWRVTYHSKHGAIQESEHIFIREGLHYVSSHHLFAQQHTLCVFEMGFGTGLNALLTCKESVNRNVAVYYHAAELFPLSEEEAKTLNYVQQLKDESLSPVFSFLHKAEWNKDIIISPQFTLRKYNCSLYEVNTPQRFHLIYFDAFAPDAQPELWTAAVFQQMHSLLCDDGVLVTYCSKGVVRRTLEAVGFRVIKLKGPPGKREIIRAVKR